MVEEWKPSQKSYPDICLHQWIELQVEQLPDNIAVIFEEQHITYQELNCRANQLAHYLRTLNVGSEVLVGICLERSLDLVIGLLGILKAGGAYVPLDPAYPQERLALMLEDSQLPVLLSQHSQINRLPKHRARLICLDSDWDTITQHSRQNLDSNVKAENLAYTIYTSGSTGKPKGVQIEHRAVVNFLNSMRQEPGLTQQDVLLAITTICFDIAALEIYLPLIVGAQLVLVSREVASDAAKLDETIVKSGITVMQATPATWQLLLAAGWQGNKQLKILCGGEALNRRLANQLLEKVHSLWNMYGPTETTIWSTVHQVEPENSPVSIGRPIANTKVYLLDPLLRRKEDEIKPVPIGMPGEIYIGGVCLARGYLNRPELNEEKFILNPFNNEPKDRLYKTGDLARYLPDGSLEFIGRTDNQVKIRGYRIELGEIEAAIAQHLAVREVVVVARQDLAADDTRLVAYVVPRTQLPQSQQMLGTASYTDQTDLRQELRNETDNKSSDLASVDWIGSFGARHPQQRAKDLTHQKPHLRAFLKEKLPDYMIPSAFVLMDTLPLMPNGKVDRRALPAPNQLLRSMLTKAFVAPQTQVEKQLAEIWTQLLGTEPIGVHDNFFELGGHSLLAAQLLFRIREAFQVELPLDCLFQSPTVAKLAQVINNALSLNSGVTTGNIAVIDLEAEATLDQAIYPKSLAIEPVTTSKQIFLTGVTGFLGAFLLHELLQQTTANIYCLVRASSFESAKQKIRKNLERYLLWSPELDFRIIPVTGDLSQPFLGLTEQAFEELAAEIELIYHSGACVNLIYPYIALRATNVLGTQEILRLASQSKVKPVHFISTLDVFQTSHYLGMKVIQEQDPLNDGEGLTNGYAQSKWVAEKLIMAARERGIPIHIYRPGMISGHSQTGASHTSDLVCRMLKGFIQLRSAPDLDLMVNITPVDYVSKAIVYLSKQQESLGKAFHLVNPHPLHLSKLIEEICSLGYFIQQIAYDQWQAELLNVNISQENALSPLLSLFTQKIPKKQLTYIESSSLGFQSFDYQNTVDGLAGTTIVCPPVDAQLLSVYFSYFTRSGFLDFTTSN